MSVSFNCIASAVKGSAVWWGASGAGELIRGNFTCRCRAMNASFRRLTSCLFSFIRACTSRVSTDECRSWWQRRWRPFHVLCRLHRLIKGQLLCGRRFLSSARELPGGCYGRNFDEERVKTCKIGLYGAFGEEGGEVRLKGFETASWKVEVMKEERERRNWEGWVG